MDPNPLPPARSANRLEVLQTPFCGELRAKKFYLNDKIFTEAEEYYDASGHIWCYHTQMPIGPDGRAVAPEVCGPDRKCYRSALAQPMEWAPIVLNKREDPDIEV